MAIYWSWAWGDETLTQLTNEMDWSANTSDTSRIAPRTDRTYGYPGSPTRYGLGTTNSRHVETPPGTWLQKGAVAVSVFATSDWKHDYNDAPIIASLGDKNGIYLFVTSPASAGEIRLTFDNNSSTFSDHIVSGSWPADEWHYIVLKYDHSLPSPTAEVWINGALQCQATASWTDAISTTGVYRTGGFSNDSSLPAGVIGQIIVYDTGSQIAGNFYDPVYCTRVEPTVDIGTSKFQPSTGSHNFAVLDSPFDSSIFTSNTSSVAGDSVICEASGALGWYSQLGTTPTIINGLTVHAFASGSGQNGFSAVSNDNSTYLTGTHFTPDISDPTYGWVTAGAEPSSGLAWNTASLLYVKYEVS